MRIEITKQKESAFSGLEAAIVLIAFVVVAAVFSYVMLGAGFFATQKSQEVTYSGIKQATSNMVIDGQIYGDHTDIETVTFWLSIPPGGQAQNLGTADLKFLWTVGVSEVHFITDYDVDESPAGADSPLLQPGAKAKIELDVSSYSGGLAGPGDTFTLEIKPKTGAATLITKSLVTGYKGGVIY